MTSKGFRDRLWQIVIECTGGVQKEFAKKIGESTTNVNNWLNPDLGRNPSEESLREIGQIFKIDLNWLLTGIGPKYIESRGGYAHRVAEEEAEYGLSPQEIEYMAKLKTILKSGNDPIIGMVKASIDAAHGHIEEAKKPRL